MIESRITSEPLKPPAIVPYRGPSAAQWGMIAFLLSEAAFFSTLVMVYIVFIGADTRPGGRGGPTPADVLSMGLVIGTTICLLSSSATIHFAERALRRGGETGFRLWWALTIALAIAFLLGTAYEWRELIAHGLTVQRNLFGTTYYTLIGFHGAHVTVGVIIMLIVLLLALRRQVTAVNAHGVELVSWYWHFVDAVWIVVFTVVYIVGRYRTMPNEMHESPQPERQTVEMPQPNVWPMVLGLGIVLMAIGVALHVAFLAAGVGIFLAGLAGWIGELLPGRGHHHEEKVEPERRAKPVEAEIGKVEQLHPGLPGYRFQLPEKVHPVSAGVRGGLLGGLVMPLPAVAYGFLSEHHSPWYPINLLAGMLLPGVENMTMQELEQFHATLFVVALLIHVVNSAVFGLIYGVLLPTLPEIPRPLAWGGLLMPLLWTAVSFSVMSIVNPVLARGVSWEWFIVSQFVFGLAAAGVVLRQTVPRFVPAGILGGLAGGVLMPIPAILWSLANHHGLWYPVNLLAGLVVPGMGEMNLEQLEQFHSDWLAKALVIHALLCLGFGFIYGLLLPRLPTIPGSVAWGGLLMPLLWTATAYSLMGVVNKVLQRYVDWPWFIVSQFVFGLVASVVVHRSEKIPVPPAGPGPASE